MDSNEVFRRRLFTRLFDQCIACGEPITVGRIDKRFCNEYCRNNYNNALNHAPNNLSRNICRALFQNYRILRQHTSKEKVLIQTLISAGYKTNLITGYSRGKYLYHCFNITFKIKGDSFLFITDPSAKSS